MLFHRTFYGVQKKPFQVNSSRIIFYFFSSIYEFDSFIQKDGVASKKKSLFQILQDYIEPKISQSEMDQASQLFPFNSPQTKEALFYRKTFTEMYPNCDHFTPYIWLPKWYD